AVSALEAQADGGREPPYRSIALLAVVRKAKAREIGRGLAALAGREVEVADEGATRGGSHGDRARVGLEGPPAGRIGDRCVPRRQLRREPPRRPRRGPQPGKRGQRRGPQRRRRGPRSGRAWCLPTGPATSGERRRRGRDHESRGPECRWSSRHRRPTRPAGGYMQPSPSLGPPWLSLSLSLTLPCGMWQPPFFLLFFFFLLE